MPKKTKTICIKTKKTSNYDFKVCNDEILITLENQIKKRKEFLKSLTESIITVDEDGVITTHNKPKYTSDITLEVKLWKAILLMICQLNLKEILF